jgi:predicted ArsR family transcriptional regulator
MAKSLEDLVLMILSEKAEVSPSDLAEEMGIPASLILEVFEELRNKGLLEEAE